MPTALKPCFRCVHGLGATHWSLLETQVNIMPQSSWSFVCEFKLRVGKFYPYKVEIVRDFDCTHRACTDSSQMRFQQGGVGINMGTHIQPGSFLQVILAGKGSIVSLQ